MLSSSELQTLAEFSEAGVNELLLQSWVDEVRRGRERLRADLLFQQLRQRAERWIQQNTTSTYARELPITDSRLQGAFARLIERLRQSLIHQGHDPLQRLVIWVIEEVSLCAQSAELDPSFDLLDALEAIEQQLCQRAWRAIPQGTRERLDAALEIALARAKSPSPYDQTRGERAVAWRLLREELQLPSLTLIFHEDW